MIEFFAFFCIAVWISNDYLEYKTLFDGRYRTYLHYLLCV